MVEFGVWAKTKSAGSYSQSMVEDIQEFLLAKGGVGVLVSLYDEDRTYSEILERVDVTSSTLSKRLDDADDEGLVDISRTHRHGRRTKEFYLTELGYEVALELSKQGVVSNYRKMITLKEQVDEGTDAVIDAVADREVGFAMHPDRDQKTGREQYQEMREAREPDSVGSSSESGHKSENSDEPGSDSDDDSGNTGQLDVWETIERHSEQPEKENDES